MISPCTAGSRRRPACHSPAAPAPATAAVRRRVVAREDQAVVLVGGDGLLRAAFGAEGQPAGTLQVQPSCCATSCTGRSVSTSLRWLISSVSERADSPCASRAARSAGCPAPRPPGSGRSAASRGPAADAPAATAAAARTGRARRRWRPHARLGDRHVAQAVARHQQRRVLHAVAASSVCTGCAHHARRSAWPIGGCASATRSSTSWRVKMPSGGTGVVEHQHRADARSAASAAAPATAASAARRSPAHAAAGCPGALPSTARPAPARRKLACSACRDRCQHMLHAAGAGSRPAARCARPVRCIASAGTSRQKLSSSAV